MLRSCAVVVTALLLGAAQHASAGENTRIEAGVMRLIVGIQRLPLRSDVTLRLSITGGDHPSAVPRRHEPATGHSAGSARGLDEASAEFELDRADSSPAASLRFDRQAPYRGIGLDAWFGREGRVGLRLDIGMIRPDAPLATFGGQGGELARQDALLLETLAEESRQLRRAESDAYPVALLGIAFRF